MGNEAVQVVDAAGFIRDTQRRIQQQERRVVPRQASDLLGPGYGPRAVQTLDWNAEEPSFSGQFWSPIGAINGPDSSKEWIGLTLAEDTNYKGVQILWSLGTPAREMRRTWASLDGGVTRTYAAWTGNTDWTAVVTDAGWGTSPSSDENHAEYRIVSGMVVFHGMVFHGTFAAQTAIPTSTADLTVFAALPASIRPATKVLNTLAGSQPANDVRAAAFPTGRLAITTGATTGTYFDLSNFTWPAPGV